jgi:heptosyltransferase III
MTIPTTARSPCGRVREGLFARGASPNFTALNQNLHQSMSAETETILIVRPGALGDTILSLPLLASIRSEHPDARITFLGNPTYQDLLPSNTDFQSIDSSKWLWLFGSRTDVGSPRTFDRAYVILNRAEDVAHNLLNSGTKFVLTASSTPPRGKHAVAHLHEALGFPEPSRRPALRELAPRDKSDVMWIHPGSGGSRKCVPLETITRLAEILRSETGLAVAVTAGEADDFLRHLPEWQKLTGGPRTYLAENWPLPELCEQLGGARLFVGNDSGISHLAANLGIPSAVFFISSDPIQWSPWVPEHQLRIIDCRGGSALRLDLEREARGILELGGL